MGPCLWSELMWGAIGVSTVWVWHAAVSTGWRAPLRHRGMPGVSGDMRGRQGQGEGRHPGEGHQHQPLEEDRQEQPGGTPPQAEPAAEEVAEGPAEGAGEEARRGLGIRAPRASMESNLCKCSFGVPSVEGLLGL